MTTIYMRWPCLVFSHCYKGQYLVLGPMFSDVMLRYCMLDKGGHNKLNLLCSLLGADRWPL